MEASDQRGALVELENVSLQYGESEFTIALRDASLTAQPGEFVAVVGPSGCGKSTLMKAATGLWKPSKGTVRVSGKVVDRPLSIVGMAFQNSTLLPWRTTLDNVMLPLEIVQPHASRLAANRAEYEQSARELLALVGLSGYENAFPWQLSGGMQQRCQLCRSLIHDPKLLMLDEPFGALDMFTREELWQVLQKLWLVRRPTVVLVTHDLREAVFLADRILVMSARPGKIIFERQIDNPRPRDLETTYEASSVEAVHELRSYISSARAAINDPLQQKPANAVSEGVS
ncbi:ABC transporter ATP-binding protein [Aureimonas fodinaquatilis]|uniref:ABC transporter ATP-binding protein n=1 Tax=Aureimonas fodinaquatilis TaxID=2565783 RepID=A0A5B0DSM4_9HYPH|nr:ABC transporter ATP-binding protein [Aureimonas fodinaquatilis]KAA0969012.1 ABC transporter ATP-binding protein [Aureimonas fodinaquatilis]